MNLKRKGVFCLGFLGREAAAKWNRKERAAALRINKYDTIYCFILSAAAFLNLFHFHFFRLAISAINHGVSSFFISLDAEIVSFFAL